jgi:hypothetical protein
MKKLFVLRAGMAVAVSLLVFSGCGKIAGPISPLVNPPVVYSFDNGTEGWVYDYSQPYPVVNPPALTMTNESVLNGTGALQIQIPYLELNGSVTLNITSWADHIEFPGTLDMTNKTLAAWVYLKSGLVEAPNRVGAQIFLKDSSWRYANGTFAKLVPNQWTQVTYNVNAPNYQANPPPDVSKVKQLGIQIAGDGSAYFTSPGVVIMDNFGYQ